MKDGERVARPRRNQPTLTVERGRDRHRRIAAATAVATLAPPAPPAPVPLAPPKVPPAPVPLAPPRVPACPPPRPPVPDAPPTADVPPSAPASQATRSCHTLPPANVDRPHPTKNVQAINSDRGPSIQPPKLLPHLHYFVFRTFTISFYVTMAAPTSTFIASHENNPPPGVFFDLAIVHLRLLSAREAW